jgi:hypothetical protein
MDNGGSTRGESPRSRTLRSYGPKACCTLRGGECLPREVPLVAGAGSDWRSRSWPIPPEPGSGVHDVCCASLRQIRHDCVTELRHVGRRTKERKKSTRRCNRSRWRVGVAAPSPGVKGFRPQVCEIQQLSLVAVVGRR